MSRIIVIVLAGILTNNMVLSKFLGICPFLGVSKKLNTAFSMSVAVTFVMVMATAVTYPLYAWVLVPLKLDYLQTIVFILVIATLVQLLEMFFAKFVPPIHKAMGIYLPLITTNCAVLGITILNFTAKLSYVESLFNALGAGLGFSIAMIMFAGVRKKLETCDPPEWLRGLPITLISAAIVSLSFLGFAGIVGI